VGWKVAATLALPGTAHEVETQALPGEARTVRIDGKAASQLDLARLIPILWLVPAMDRLWTEGAEGRRRFLDRAALSLFPDHGEASLALRKSDARAQPPPQGRLARRALVRGAGKPDGPGRHGRRSQP
jgi:DNA replication and repair protein RecF